jgi:hypothetical protein
MVGLKQTWFNVISYPSRYKYVNQTAPKYVALVSVVKRSVKLMDMIRAR